MYAKLSSTITRSSIWREPPPTRCVWITLLAVANEDGFVKGVEAWLSNEANVSREECRAALEIFEAVDPESQDQDYGGRRIEKVEGGWLILNYLKYRGMRTKQQVLGAERQSRKRVRDKEIATGGGGGGEDVTLRHGASRPVTPIAPATASALAGEEREKGISPPPAPHADRFQHAPHREAYLAARRAHRHPGAFDAALQHEVHQPITGGQSFAWDVIGGALLQLQANGESFNVARLRGYCRSQAANDSPARGSPPSSAAEVIIGGQGMSHSVFWRICTESGLTAPMQSLETVRETIARLHRRGLILNPVAFEACVLAIDLPAIAAISWAKTREEQLRVRLADWARGVPV